MLGSLVSVKLLLATGVCVHCPLLLVFAWCRRIPVFTGGDRRAVVGLFLVKDLLRHKADGSVSLGQVQMRPLPR
jgi:hypothetical protein